MEIEKVPAAASMTVTFFGEGQHLFEPMAARCTTTTIISSSSSCW
ncbi:plantazolicin family RiPP [Microbacterium lacticum]|nr:plantazolicin family RiPP [Microbacterium lacticum]MCC9053896.1 plantazolicin family TOMM peptide [Microbacterium sp. F2E]